MKKFAFPGWTVPFALLFLCLISFGTMASKLGFYWDDWPSIWSLHFYGPSGFREAFAIDRPLLAWTFMATTRFLGESPVVWQIFAIFSRWLACVALWWTLLALWPGKPGQVTWMAMLFAIYPGFNQQFISVTYGNGFIIYAIFLISLGSMLWAFRRPAWFWPLIALSILLSAYCLFTVEYFFGLELLRPVLLWLVLSDSYPGIRKQLPRLALYWMPYGLLLFIFSAWRVMNKTPRAEISIFEKLSSSPLATAFELVRTIFQDLFKVTALAWSRIFNFSGISAYEPITIQKYAAIVIIPIVLFVLYLAKSNDIQHASLLSTSGSPRRWSFQAILVGVWALLVSGIPIWVTDLHIDLFFPWDRFTLPTMVGVSILVVGLIDALLTRHHLLSIVVVSIAIGLAAGLHFQSALEYRKDWLEQKDFFWQLTWRAPGITPGTALLTSEMPFTYDSDNSLTAPLNWTYASSNTSWQIPYLLYNIESRLGTSLPALEKGQPIHEPYRVTPFDGTTSQALLVFYSPPACLKVINPLTDQRLPDKPLYYRDALALSNPDLILVNADPAAQPPISIFGSEPAHGWCYYFEKAELARQKNDWQEIARLGEQGLITDKKFYRKNVGEMIPFMEGYAHIGQWNKALKLSLDAYQVWENMRYVLCDTWESIHQSTKTDDQQQAAYEKIQEGLQCARP